MGGKLVVFPGQRERTREVEPWNRQLAYFQPGLDDADIKSGVMGNYYVVADELMQCWKVLSEGRRGSDVVGGTPVDGQIAWIKTIVADRRLQSWRMGRGDPARGDVSRSH